MPYCAPMTRNGTTGFALLQALLPFTVLLLVAAALYGAAWWVDFGGSSAHPGQLWTEPGAVATLTSFSEVTVGVLGIAITVVAIIVELAANRYTPRITDLFVRDPINIAVMGFFVVTAVVVLWVDMSLYGPHHPRTMALLATGLMTMSLLAILPYFAYVFDFLSPTRVIELIRMNGASHVRRMARGASTVEPARTGVVTAIEQLGDIALNSVDKKDKPLTLSALGALATLTIDAMGDKERLPAAWFDTRPLVRHDQDFIALHPDMVRALTQRKTWLEMKVLRQYQAVFGEAVNRMRDVNHLIGIHTRRLAVQALDGGDVPAFQLAVRFLNTYLRAAINARDVRSAYNLFNEYRLLAEHALDNNHGDTVLELATHLKYYGQLAFSMNLAFILETAAYDLCTLLELAAEAEADCHDTLLGVFLDVDREPDADRQSQETSLRGVRKAQIKLATHYLARGRTERARRIYADLRGENPERLRSIRGEIERVEDAEYWEVSDRGINFEWLPADQRAQLETFFGWFSEPTFGDEPT